MGIHRTAAKRDDNEPLIVEALQKAGAMVVKLAKPVDLLVGHRGTWLLMEVKDGDKIPSKQRLTDDQFKFVGKCSTFGLPVAVVKTPEEALAALTGRHFGN